MQLLAARIAHERGQASQRATGQALEANRKHVRETTEMLRAKMEEVEHLRIQNQADDRERADKVKSLVGEVSLYAFEIVRCSLTRHHEGEKAVWQNPAISMTVSRFN